MKKSKLRKAVTTATATAAGVLASANLCASAQMPPAASSDPLVNALVKKGILTEDEARSIKAEVDTSQTNLVSAQSGESAPRSRTSACMATSGFATNTVAWRTHNQGPRRMGTGILTAWSVSVTPCALGSVVIFLTTSITASGWKPPQTRVNGGPLSARIPPLTPSRLQTKLKVASTSARFISAGGRPTGLR